MPEDLVADHCIGSLAHLREAQSVCGKDLPEHRQTRLRHGLAEHPQSLRNNLRVEDNDDAVRTRRGKHVRNCSACQGRRCRRRRHDKQDLQHGSQRGRQQPGA